MLITCYAVTDARDLVDTMHELSTRDPCVGVDKELDWDSTRMEYVEYDALVINWEPRT